MKRRMLMPLSAAVLWAGMLAPAGAAGQGCVYKGAPFSDGAASCQAGYRFTCAHGDWKAAGSPCTETPTVVPPAPVPAPCDVDGSNVTSGTTVCRGGANFTCSDGAWVAVGTTCR